MRLSDRVKETGLPLDQVVVIGSGLLEQLGLRQAQDLDLVVSNAMFERLARTGDYIEQTRHGERRLIKYVPPIEIWQSWGSGGVANFEELYANGQTFDSVRFVATETLLEQKHLRGLKKDQDDITLLERYNEEHARNY